MSYVFFYNHPVEGMYARVDQTLNEFQTEAAEFAGQHYPNVPTMDCWTLTGWWLMENDGLPFFRPKPWPLAFALKKSAFHDVLGCMPNYLILLAYGPNDFGYQKAETLDEARETINRITQNQVALLKNDHEGLTGDFTDPDGMDRQVAHVIMIPL